MAQNRNHNRKLTASILKEILPQKPSKSDLRRIKIINGAIATYSDIGVKYVSYEDIGRKAKTSSALIQHYFPNKQELFLTMIKLVRGQFQQLTVEAIGLKKDPMEIMEAYVRSTFKWLEQYPEHVQVWIFFFYQCGADESLRKIHLELTEMGQSRIIELLRMGTESKAFRTSMDLSVLAKQIQKIITGGLLEVQTEAGPTRLKKIEDETWQLCRLLLI